MSRSNRPRPPGEDECPIKMGSIDLHPIGSDDGQSIAEACRISGTGLWASTTAFLRWYDRSVARHVVTAKIGASLVVGVVRKVKGSWRFDAMLPPQGVVGPPTASDLPMLLTQANGDNTGRALWLDGAAATALKTDTDANIRFSDYEYLYDPQKVRDLTGANYNALRKYIHRFERESQPTLREFNVTDAEPCRHVLKGWVTDRKKLASPLVDTGYTHAALDMVQEVDGVQGLVVEMEGVIRAFALWGPMPNGWASFLVLKADIGVPYLSVWTRYQAFSKMAGRWETVNDASDLPRPGLAQHKRLFGPKAFLPTFAMDGGG